MTIYSSGDCDARLRYSEPDVQSRRAGPKRLDRGAGTAAAAATTLLRGVGPREDERPQVGEARQPGDAPPGNRGAPEAEGGEGGQGGDRVHGVVVHAARHEHTRTHKIETR